MIVGVDVSTTEAIKRVQKAAHTHASAQVKLHAAISEALEAGCSLREVARATGLSHEHVRRFARLLP